MKTQRDSLYRCADTRFLRFSSICAAVGLEIQGLWTGRGAFTQPRPKPRSVKLKWLRVDPEATPVADPPSRLAKQKGPPRRRGGPPRIGLMSDVKPLEHECCGPLTRPVLFLEDLRKNRAGVGVLHDRGIMYFQDVRPNGSRLKEGYRIGGFK